MRFSRIALSSSCLLLTLALLAGAQDGKQSSDAAKQAYAFAKTFQDKKLYDDAIRQWQKFLKDHGKDPLAADAFSNLGVSQLLGKHYRDAAVTLRALLDKHPKYEGADAATFNLGLALFNIGLESKKPDDFKAAADAFGQLPVKYTKSKYAPQALYYQGECHFNAGNAQQALAFYRKAISAYPEATILPDVYYALGTAQQDALKQYKDAADTYADFLKKYPRDTYADEIRLRRGDCLVELKDYAEAERVLAEAAGNPNFEFADYALLQQARAVSEQKNFAKAAELYASLTKKFPASKRQEAALVGAGKNYHLAGKHNEAQQALRAVADKNGKHSAEGAYWLAQSLIKTGKPTEASTVAERALAAFPKDEFAPHLELVRIDAIDAQPDKKKQAAQLYADFAKKHAGQPLAARAQYLAALTALQAGDSSGAAKLAEDFLADAKQGKSPLVPEVQFIAGESALLKSPADYVRAETHFRNLVENNADHERA
ncbi:MAG: tol-pal system YbgF family protein, partial [Gemmataceae bacterium]